MNRLDKLVVGFLVLVFAFAGLDKVVHLHGFINALNSYLILPFPAGSILAPLVIAAELAASVGLAVRRWRRIAALQAAGLMIVFTLALAVNQLQGAEKICGCWFSIDTAQGPVHFIFNGLLIALCFLVWLSEREPADKRYGPGGEADSDVDG